MGRRRPTCLDIQKQVLLITYPFWGEQHVIGIQFSPPFSLSLALQDRVSFVTCAVLELRNLPNFVSLGLELEACVTRPSNLLSLY